MKELKDIMIDILNEIDEEIVEFEGENLVEDGLLDSFTIVVIMTKIEEKLHITISPDDVTEDNFKSVDAIISLVEKSK